MNEKNIEKDITSVLAEIASEIVGQFDMEVLLGKIITTTMDILHAEVCSIFLEDRERAPGILKCVAGSGFAKKIVNKAMYNIGEGFTGSIAKYGEGLNISSRDNLKNLEIGGQKVWQGKHDNMQWPSAKSQFRNLIALPLKIKNEILGVIKVENKIEEFGPSFSKEDYKTFSTIANVIALTIENARWHHKAKEQSKTIQNALSEIAGAVVGQFNMQELLDKIVNTTMKTLDAEICSIFLENREENKGYIKCVAGSGYALNIVGIAEYKIGEGFTGHIAKEGEEFNISESDIEDLKARGLWTEKYDHLEHVKGPSNFRNLIAVPLKIKDHILGVIKIENKKQAPLFTDEDFAIFKIIANVIAMAIVNTSLLKTKEERDAWIEVSRRAAHILGNALFGLRGDVDWLKIVVKDKIQDNKEILTAIKSAQIGLNEANNIIREFKNYTSANFTFVNSNVNTILEDVISKVQKAVGEDIKFRTNLSKNLKNTKLDILKFKQCIRELLENACVAIKNKGEITIESRNSSRTKNIMMNVPRDNDLVTIIIMDNGKGVPDKDKKLIFMPFYSTNPNGTGLGLSIVQQYVEKHHGKITEIGEYGSNALFQIVLPAVNTSSSI